MYSLSQWPSIQEVVQEYRQSITNNRLIISMKNSY